MRKLLICLMIGIIAGIIDVIPMIVQKLDIYANASAFVHWIVLGIIIPYVSFKLKGWIKGLVIAVISSLPVIIIVLKDNPCSVIPILVMSVVLGSLVGFAGEKYADKK